MLTLVEAYSFIIKWTQSQVFSKILLQMNNCTKPLFFWMVLLSSAGFGWLWVARAGCEWFWLVVSGFGWLCVLKLTYKILIIFPQPIPGKEVVDYFFLLG